MGIGRKNAVAVDEPDDFPGILCGMVHLIGTTLGAGDDRVAVTDLGQGVIAAAAVGKANVPVPGESVQLPEHLPDGAAFIINGDDHSDLHVRKSFRT